MPDHSTIETKSPTGRARYTKWTRTLVGSASVLTLGLFLFTWTARYFYVAELLVNFQVQLLLLVAVVLAMALFAKLRKLSLALALVFMWLTLQWGWLWIPPAQPAAGPETIRIMSFNVWTANRDTQIVKQRIADVDPDVLMIAEYDAVWHKNLESLRTEFPYHHLAPRWHGYGIACFSKRPLLNARTIQLIRERTDAPMIVAEVPIGTRSIRLIGVHLISPTNSFRLTMRNAQLDEISDHVNEQQTSTVLMGDFNCTPASPYLRDLLRETGMRDSRQGFGSQATWNCELWPLMIPIDHFLVSPDCHIQDRSTAAAAGSDHLPIVMEISLPE